jgi:FtsH-binding integral membrane protein
MSSPQPDRVPLDACIVERFHAELPTLLAMRETRWLSASRTWGWEAISYAAITAVGLAFWGWSPVLVLLHLMSMQWISLVAEVVVLLRLRRAGVCRLRSAAHVNRFVETVLAVRALANRPAARAVPMLPADCLLDDDLRFDDSSRSSPGALAGTLVFFGVVATAVMLLVLAYAQDSLRETLRGQTAALVFMAMAAGLRFRSQIRATTAPVYPGARWNVEFLPGLRVVSVVVLAMLSPAMLLSPAVATGWVLVLLGCVGMWGAVTLATLPQFRRSTDRMRACIAECSRGEVQAV